MRRQRTICHIRQLAKRPEGKPRAWSPRLVLRVPRFRWKAQLKCRRRCVFARNPEAAIVMRRPFCRSRTFRAGLAA